MRRARILWAAALIATIGGCQDRSLGPLHPCTVQVAGSQLRVDPIRDVDLLFMVDDSGSMSQEQSKLRAEIPRLVRVLATGDTNEDGVRDFPEVQSLQVGFVSSNMGSNGANPVSTTACGGLGDDGILKTGPGCSLPSPILSFNAGGDLASFIGAVECASNLGTDGCGVEQQLDAMLKAVTPSTQRIFYGGGGGHGDGANLGFLRPDSLLAIVLITDEEDCSTDAIEPFDIDRADRSTLNVLCHRNRDRLYPIARYVDALRQVRDPGSLVFGVIAGVPPELTASGEPDYDAILGHPAMLPTEIDSGEFASLFPGEQTRNISIRPVCSVPDRDGDGRADTIADPAVRMVELARALRDAGVGTVVQSICQDSFRTALDSILQRIADRLKVGCLPRPLIADSSGEVRCRVVEDLPAGMSCAQAGPNRTSLGYNVLGTERCEVGQVPVFAQTPTPGASGWFYDDFTPDRAPNCSYRVNFTSDARPLNGVLLRLECLSATVNTETTVTVGTSCLNDTSICANASPDTLQTFPRGLVCDTNKNTCQASCATEADCPAGYVCDETSYCVNPTCGA